MKKIYLLISSITLGSLAFGQVDYEKTSSDKVFKRGYEEFINTNAKPHSTEKLAGDTIAKEDFNGANSLNSWVKGGTNGSVWMFDTDGPNGHYSTNAVKIASPTNANGFVIFDADVANYPSYADSLNGTLTSPAIDLSTFSGVNLVFWNSYRVCCTSKTRLRVQVSTNDFTNFNEYIVNREDIPTNAYSGTFKSTINLKSYLSTATNKQNLKIRFVFSGYDSYFWMIDDISFVENLTNDLELSKVVLNKFLAPNHQYFPANVELTSIPLEFADTLLIQGYISNKGNTPISNSTKLKVNILDQSKNIIASSVAGGTLFGNASSPLIGDTIDYKTTIDLSKLAIGTYTVAVILNGTDDNAKNDTIKRVIKITNGLMGQELYETTFSSTENPGYNGAGTVQDHYSVGNIYFIPSTTTANQYLQGLEVTLRTNSTYLTTAKTEITLKVFEVTTANGFNSGRFTDLLEDRSFIIGSSDIPTANTNNSIMLNIAKNGGPIELVGNKIYAIGVYHNGGAVNNVNQYFSFAAQNFDDDNTSIINTLSSTTHTDQYYTLGKQFLSRLSFDRSLGLEENVSEISNSNLFPNPTTGKSTVSYTLENASKVTVKVVDVTGKVVYTSSEESKEAGNHTSTIDATAFNTGVYYVTVSTNDSQLTQKLIKK